MTTIREFGNELRTAAEAAERIDSSQPVTLDELAPGRAFAQGDVAILALAKRPTGWREIEMPPNGQIAPGNTKGARHCLATESQAVVKIYRIDDGDRLSDLGIVAKAPWTLEHPEHAWVTFPAGVYRVLHQQNEQRERVLD